ncbi:bifunctional phosphopantothenoylcysteine decarboxylase/phosphopantothenate--cysteine ligase CoaBC [Caldicoprobacter algeriensis]|uniref:bifunctional phosphopantothenoylcysteine decarboxylase/phosphopantothenate--cysteine ligase CoaBC n=1 Tax=Caldicoprobacter algeriensis TaxID=699281 RepID=UPI002079F797|nr:bifunctional phosphopantothenoylcysteine decarboxylase/phosphopantothenate--cysteine ligase CoaBC [Caldicoprobacter algeriensis]MCM8899782.1 bifunctional phosphopantothenoylcysteine decarboxylase/phosphopantothenate--cysteine ligase CoaBC [Caldicoprobacter algeriensis]
MDAVKDKKIVIGITGGIAAYKAAEVVSSLVKRGAQVKVIMTAHAMEFIKPLTLETLSGNPVYYDMFSRPGAWEIDHISLAKWADLLVVVPATANILGKVAHGIADDLLSTTIMATRAQVIFAPAMNTNMYTNPIVQENMSFLKSKGYMFIPPAAGRLACGDYGEGKLADVQDILDVIENYFSRKSDLKGLRILVTAGPTREYLDPVRFISNPSSGKMGYAIAAACAERGADVELVSGPVSISPPPGVKLYRVETAKEMFEKVMEIFPLCHMVFKAAAVGDYRPETYYPTKIKKDNDRLTLTLVKNPDILKELGKRKGKCILVGFAAETENIEEYAMKKMREKNLDFIVANDVTRQGAGFEKNTNEGLLVTREGEVIAIPQMDKKEFAHRIIDEVIKRCPALCQGSN